MPPITRSKKASAKDNLTELEKPTKKQSDSKSMALLVILYLLQGVPLGLAMGSLPFILKNKLNYAQLAVLSFTAYPYSLKLFWSPFVDSIYSRRFGRRKSWIIPIQFLCGILMLWLGLNIDAWLGIYLKLI
jgi:PAT family acetyl-CoA transporter-like MFS transporter 1